MKCPGQDTQYWKPGAIFEVPCPECGVTVEFFKDDTSRKCRSCGHRFVNPHLDFGCAAYCQYADQCIGNLPPEVLQSRDDLFKDRVAVAMKRYFGTDFKRIAHAVRVARHAEHIGRSERANLAVALCAAYLHDVGLHEAEEKHGADAADHHEELGGPVAASIMQKLGAGADLAAEVCDIVTHHHHPGEDEELNFRVVYDADRIVNLEERQKKDPMPREEMEAELAVGFLTEAGKKLAQEILLVDDA